MRLAAFVSALGSLLLFLGSGPLLAQEATEDWPMAGGDPAHRATAPGPAPPYREVWSAEIEGGPLAAPVVADDRVVVVGGQRIAAFDAATGEALWDVVRPSGPAGPAAMVGELAIHASGQGQDAGLVGRSVETGTPRWRTATGSPVGGGITADGGRVYAGTGEGVLLALEAETGEEAWRLDLPGTVISAPAVAGGVVLTVAQDREAATTTVLAVDIASGEEEWRFATPPFTPGATAPAAGDRAVFVGLGDARVHALDLETGAERWATRARAATLGTVVFFTAVQTPAVPGDPLVGDLAHLARFDAATGVEEWAFRFPDLVATSAPAVAGGSVVIGDGSGFLSAVDLNEGVVVWQQRLGTLPVSGVAADGRRVYAGTLGRGGEVVALEHDPGGSLIRIESATTLSPLRAVLNFLAAGAAVGLVSLALFRYVVRPRRPAEVRPP
jgi:outer membrane protein assembly factor BamB